MQLNVNTARHYRFLWRWPTFCANGSVAGVYGKCRLSGVKGHHHGVDSNCLARCSSHAHVCCPLECSGQTNSWIWHWKRHMTKGIVNYVRSCKLCKKFLILSKQPFLWSGSTTFIMIIIDLQAKQIRRQVIQNLLISEHYYLPNTRQQTCVWTLHSPRPGRNAVAEGSENGWACGAATWEYIRLG